MSWQRVKLVHCCAYSPRKLNVEHARFSSPAVCRVRYRRWFRICYSNRVAVMCWTVLVHWLEPWTLLLSGPRMNNAMDEGRAWLGADDTNALRGRWVSRHSHQATRAVLSLCGVWVYLFVFTAWFIRSDHTLLESYQFRVVFG